MIDGERIAVVVPARNEAERIAAVVSSMPAWVDQVVLIDDASTDETSARARAAQGGAALEVVRLGVNQGVGAAVMVGYRRAAVLGADVMAVMAGDGQMDPADLRRLVEPVVRGRAGYAKGNRLRFPGVWRRMPWPRLLGTAVLGHLTSWATGVRVRDSQCGYTALSRPAWTKIAARPIWPRYGYPNDLIGVLAEVGERIEEVVVRPVYRGEGSGLRPWHLWAIARILARLAFNRL